MKKDFQFSYELLSDWKDLSIEDQVLVDKAYDALETAYAPYSEFKVGQFCRIVRIKDIQMNPVYKIKD